MDDSYILSFVYLCISFRKGGVTAGFSQRRDRSLKQDTPVVVPDTKQDLSRSDDFPAFYDVRKYGAKGTSAGLETDAINKQHE